MCLGQHHTQAHRLRGGDKPRTSPGSIPGSQALQWPQTHLMFRNLPLELLTQGTAVSLTCFSCTHALCFNPCASLRCSWTSHDGTPVTPTAHRAQATKSREGSEFLLYTILGTKTMAVVYHSSTLHFGHLYWNMSKSDRVKISTKVIPKLLVENII